MANSVPRRDAVSMAGDEDTINTPFNETPMSYYSCCLCGLSSKPPMHRTFHRVASKTCHGRYHQRQDGTVQIAEACKYGCVGEQTKKEATYRCYDVRRLVETSQFAHVVQSCIENSRSEMYDARVRIR